MARRHDGFITDSARTVATQAQYFYGGDGAHPWARSYQFSAELLTSLVRQVRSWMAIGNG